MIFRAEDARLLHNARQRKLNIVNGDSLNFNTINKKQVAKKIFPHYSDSALTSSANKIRKGLKMVRPQWVIDLAEYLGVDSNFLFGEESVHDQDYNTLIVNR